MTVMSNAYGKIIANVEQLHRLMDEEGISAIVARSGKNFTYLAGFAYPGTLARQGVWKYQPYTRRCNDAGTPRRQCSATLTKIRSSKTCTTG